jgi:NADH-quinone oxidoreductase subunit F
MKKPWRSILITGIAAAFAVAATVAVTYKIDTELCTQCGLCIENCPDQAITVEKVDGEEIHVIDQAKCTHCGKCAEACPVDAIKASGKPNNDKSEKPAEKNTKKKNKQE